MLIISQWARVEKHRASGSCMETPMQQRVPFPLNKGHWDWSGEVACGHVQESEATPGIAANVCVYVPVRLCVCACGFAHGCEEGAGGLVYRIRGLERCG